MNTHDRQHTRLDAQKIRRALDAAPWQQGVRQVFLGTVPGLTPSGKYYTIFARGNVTDDEAEQDTAWLKAADQTLGEIGASLECGADDPCDLFAVEYQHKLDAEKRPDITMAELSRWLKEWQVALETQWHADYASWSARLTTYRYGRDINTGGHPTLERAISRAIEAFEKAGPYEWDAQIEGPCRTLKHGSHGSENP